MAFENKITKNAFSLIELIVGIIISVLLMVSIGVFVTSGMQNIFSGQKSLQNTSNINDFISNLYTATNSLEDKKLINIGSNSLVFKRKKEYDMGGFTYIGQEKIDGFYCSGEKSEDMTTNHFFIKNFIPYIERGESNSDNYENWLESQLIDFNGMKIKSLQKEHKVVSENGDIIIGRGLYGTDFEEGEESTKVYLNSPTGLVVGNDNILYISDTLNDRVLYIQDNRVFTLLDETDGLNEPTGLFFDTQDKSLYISNSGLGKILKLSSPIVNEISDKELNISGMNQNNIDKISFELFLDNTQIAFENNVKVDISSFNSYTNHEKLIQDNKLIINFKKDLLNSSGVVIGQEKDFIDFVPNKEYKINLQDIGEFRDAGNYFIKVIIGEYEEIFYILTQGNEKIYTTLGNILEIYKDNLKYPSGVWKEGKNVVYNEFDFTKYTSFKLNKTYDLILSTPIKSLEISNDSGNLVNIILKLYRDYNCYNIAENDTKVETFISKINLK